MSLRKLIDGGSHEAVLRLATDQEALASQPARSLYLLAKVLEVTRDEADYVALKVSFDILKRAWRISPGDYQICRELSGYNNERFREHFGQKPRFWAIVDVDGDDTPRLPWQPILRARTLTQHWPMRFCSLPLGQVMSAGKWPRPSLGI